MNSKNTYNPEDIESLLTHKKYEELLPEEKIFVMNHIDSKDEYNLMRSTLLAIKKSAENNDAIAANPKIKEELLLLMESKANRVGWFNLNGLLAFFFPKDVIVFKKPGFQLASFAMVLILGFYISAKVIDFKPNNLAVNTKKEKTVEELPQNEAQNQLEEIKESEPDFDFKETKKAENIAPITDIQANSNGVKKTAPAPVSLFDYSEEISDKFSVKELSIADDYSDIQEIEVLEEKIREDNNSYKDEVISRAKVSSSASAQNIVADESLKVLSKKEKEIIGIGAPLSKEDKMINLLFVAL